MSEKKPVVKVTNSGGFRVDPAEIFRSDVTRAIIKKTHETVRTTKQGGTKPDNATR